MTSPTITQHLISLPSPQHTEQLGNDLAQLIPDGCLIYLRGPLGSGKTTLARGFLRGLGHQGAVKSPTFTLLEPYQVGDRSVFHFDLYRLNDPEELEFMGFRDCLEEQATILVEWPERGAGLLPPADLEIQLLYKDEQRQCQFTRYSPRLATALPGLWSSPEHS